MGGEIFKDSLRTLEVKPTQNLQKFISSETRENSQHSDININKNYISLTRNITSQRNMENNINKKEHIDRLFLRKITFEKYLLASILNKYKNKNNHREIDDKNSKEITPKLNTNNTNGTENIKTTHISKNIQINKTNSISKDKEIKNCLKYIVKHSIDSGNLINKDKNKENIRLKFKDKVYKNKVNIHNYIIIIYTNKFYIIFDPGIKIKDPGFDNKTIRLKLIVDNIKVYNWINTNIINKMNNKLYENKMNIFINEDNYPIFIDIYKLLEDNGDDDLMTIKVQWSIFLSVLELVSGLKRHFNDKFGRSNRKFENETTNLWISNEINTHSAYLEANINNKSDDELQEETRMYKIIKNANDNNLKKTKMFKK